MLALKQRDVVNLAYDPYNASGTRSAVVIDGMKTPNHPHVGRIYSVVSITKDEAASTGNTIGLFHCRKTRRKQASHR